VATAYHEAGHAVLGCTYGCFPISVSIIADDNGLLGKTEFPNDVPEAARRYLDTSPKTQRYVEQRAMRVLAGAVAHRHKFPRHRSDAGDRRDDREALELIERFKTSNEHHKAYVNMLRITARDRLMQYWSCVEAVAIALLEREQLSGGELQEIVQTAMGSTGRDGIDQT
jgi:hypothetical protein